MLFYSLWLKNVLVNALRILCYTFPKAVVCRAFVFMEGFTEKFSRGQMDDLSSKRILLPLKEEVP